MLTSEAKVFLGVCQYIFYKNSKARNLSKTLFVDISCIIWGFEAEFVVEKSIITDATKMNFVIEFVMEFYRKLAGRIASINWQNKWFFGEIAREYLEVLKATKAFFKLNPETYSESICG